MKKSVNVPVLMYHGIEDENQPAGYDDAGSLLYVLKKEQFLQQMEFLKDNGYQVISLLDLNRPEQLPEKPVVLTFDDGHRSDFTIAFPILDQFKYTACFYITTGWLGGENYLLPDQISTMHQNGMLIGTHGVTHTFFNEMNSDQLVAELRDSKSTLDSVTGSPVTCLSAPGGRLTSEIIKHSLALGYESVATSVARLYKKKDSIKSVPRVAIKNTTSLEEFSKIVSCDSAYYRRLSIKHNVLSLAKKMLGNRLYQFLRSIAFN